MVLVDTNILVDLLIEGDRTAQAQALWRRDAQWCTEPFALIEFSNVLATYQRSQALTRAEATALLGEAAQRVSTWVPVAHGEALDRAAEWGISAHDARFIAAAASTGLPLITEDARLRAAVPLQTQSLAEALAA